MSVSEGRFVELKQRDGRLEELKESDTAALNLRLFVDGRSSSHSTSDLREEALARFVRQAVAMTRLLDEDPHRRLLDPQYYPSADQLAADLDLVDARHGDLAPQRRRALLEEVEQACRREGGPIVSAQASWSDRRSRGVRIHSNGFMAESRSTRYSLAAAVTMGDAGGRKPMAGWSRAARHWEDLPTPQSVGREAAERARARLGEAPVRPPGISPAASADLRSSRVALAVP